ncbi:hypothetical protein [Streptomyces luteogriseus]|uniref:hypothetical protein n=1 Tax=Streptomyces luteogriseus TaxID=68233 RepID=UPI0028A5C385|nr:hypothetical protein [Streptomyces luteogriseus]
MLERTRTAERYARGLTAAVVAVATLLLAANTGSARAGESRPEPALHSDMSDKGDVAGRQDGR